MSAPLRYTAIAFPAYRHRLGETPHPTRDPQGHSHGRELVPAADIVHPIAANWRHCEPYLYGCDLYNHGYWWEAHEAWEYLWHEAEPKREAAVRHLLKGMIQSAACALKLEQGKRAGVERLTQRVTAYLDAAGQSASSDVLLGLPLPEWSSRLNAYYVQRVRCESSAVGHDMSAFPFIVLRVQ